MLDPVGACGSRSSPRGARAFAWTLKEALAVPRSNRASRGSVVQGKKIELRLSPVRRRRVRGVQKYEEY